jgi:dTDP-4-dehydrorhamnose 3,5-epimerase
MNAVPREPAETPCAVSRDARGAVCHCNAFDMSPVRRFYAISNSAERPVRGWLLHLRENKWMLPEQGVTRVHCAPCPDPRSAPAAPARVFTLDASSPAVLHIPPGNAFAIEQRDGARVTVFSDMAADESAADTYRFPFGGME